MNININGIISSRFQHVKVAGDFKGPVSPIVRLEGWFGGMDWDGLEGLPSGKLLHSY